MKESTTLIKSLMDAFAEAVSGGEPHEIHNKLLDIPYQQDPSNWGTRYLYTGKKYSHTEQRTETQWVRGSCDWTCDSDCDGRHRRRERKVKEHKYIDFNYSVSLSPLGIAATLDNEFAAELVLKHYSAKYSNEKSKNLIVNDLKVLSRHKKTYPDYQRVSALIKKAAAKVELDVEFNKSDKKNIQIGLLREIQEARTIEDIIGIYNKHHQISYLNYRRHAAFDSLRSGFGIFKKRYIASKVLFIEALQKKVGEIALDQDQEMVSDNEIKQLAETVFAKSHFDFGVKETDINAWVKHKLEYLQPLIPEATAPALRWTPCTGQ